MGNRMFGLHETFDLILIVTVTVKYSKNWCIFRKGPEALDGQTNKFKGILQF